MTRFVQIFSFPSFSMGLPALSIKEIGMNPFTSQIAVGSLDVILFNAVPAL